MVWYHPTQPEIDTLKSLGNKGWDWNSLYPYMKAVENNHLPTNEQRNEGANVDKDLHGFSGPVNVSFPDPMRIPDAQRLYKAAIPLVFNGVQLTDDLSHRTNTALGSTYVDFCVGCSVMSDGYWTGHGPFGTTSLRVRTWSGVRLPRTRSSTPRTSSARS